MKPRLSLALALLVFSMFPISVSSQSLVADPNDPIYSDLDEWEAKRLIGNLPIARPYPLSLVRELLGVIAQDGDEDDCSRALKHLDSLKDSGNLTIRHTSRSDFSAYRAEQAPGFIANAQLLPGLCVSANYSMWINWFSEPGNTLRPLYSTTRSDNELFNMDSDTFGNQFGTYQEIISDVSFGSTDFWLQAGIGRNSVGPIFEDGLVVGPQAPTAPRILAGFRIGKATGVSGLYELTASTDSGEGKALGKHMFFHGIQYELSPSVSIGINETILGGGAVNPIYLIPLSVFYSSQWRDGFWYSNSAFSVSASVIPVKGVIADCVIYIDDPHLKDMLSLRLDTKWKMAGQLQLTAYLNDSLIKKMRASYSMVAPYTYTHWNSQPSNSYNFETYTNMGMNFGPNLQPNSDRIGLSFDIKPIRAGEFWKDIRISSNFELVRHGNASAGVRGMDDPRYDGSIFDDGVVNGVASFQPEYDTGTTPKYFRFLTQEVIEYNARAGFNLFIPAIHDEGKRKACFSYSLSYEIEMVWNSSFVKGANVLNSYISGGVSLFL